MNKNSRQIPGTNRCGCMSDACPCAGHPGHSDPQAAMWVSGSPSTRCRRIGNYAAEIHGRGTVPMCQDCDAHQRTHCHGCDAPHPDPAHAVDLCDDCRSEIVWHLQHPDWKEHGRL